MAQLINHYRLLHSLHITYGGYTQARTTCDNRKLVMWILLTTHVSVAKTAHSTLLSEGSIVFVIIMYIHSLWRLAMCSVVGNGHQLQKLLTSCLNQYNIYMYIRMIKSFFLLAPLSIAHYIAYVPLSTEYMCTYVHTYVSRKKNTHIFIFCNLFKFSHQKIHIFCIIFF